ncbi:hypothetical protein DUF1540 [Clostridium pasteurianum DSM 525 = ATCC 6013]|uniref:DUF1540 domain-containing protein n=1 Tax=Clostridium pasteurianum DSM 525 = ATCC 6013 TaxID=1262449 RepID=A0A0H3J436_CLOPA|nr:DUF1540 domain-containing protein [Clostridium pasteurianum]AJA48239.1 hypothetical protein DUF1540 [Clostridium pasteurianum DSM 525 = ATCC 6013]AJA52227.1 hypothetical protein DUF1540 [Clostridium pasteurianum DSM 525 = ATCC 6013]AOZ75497.1 hypothetical protein AQ983_10540 [Clostridium pasteurianum DSM 525 = ATCC 6013]AOZ79292.1 hypothetical protein AQ984_10530 [Clostridium pasteurianum]ELP60609.1 hypothetical protein F502_03952 [Clostridium pasteurianum DSM 525 = ATCC 6013]
MANTSMNSGHNNSIGCTVNECKYNDRSDNYCTLQKIEVVKHESIANTVECTDCGSFEKRNQ